MLLCQAHQLFAYFYVLADNAPAVGQYDISKGPCTHGGAVLFPKDRRFKETG